MVSGIPPELIETYIGTVLESGIVLEFTYALFLYVNKKQMQKIYPLLFMLLTILFASCGVIETVFKAGMWWAFFLVALVVVIIFMVARKVGKK